MDTDRIYWLGFSAFPGIGPMRFKLLLNYFGSAKGAWEAPLQKLIDIGLGETLSQKFAAFRREFSLSGYAQKVKDLGIAILILTDKKYPRLLKEIPDAPFLLYIKGKKKESGINLPAGKAGNQESWNIEKSIAIVGTRKITSYGKEVTKKLTTDLVANGMTIVSGLALGVDAVAHQAAIEAKGKTIAVLGCGVDCCNPRSNQFLYDQIIDGHGMVLSEFPLSTRATKGLFPARNRIISGLSLGTVVTEGASDSGALITARFATEQGREVFAVPGPITSPFSQASSKLIKDGAKLVTSASDILEELNLPSGLSPIPTKKRGDSPDEQTVLDLLTLEAFYVDDIIRRLSWETGKVISTLSLLEMKGFIKNEGGMYSIQ